MNRVIKFRAWNAVSKEIIPNGDLLGCFSLCELLNVNDEITKFMQFTGLTDKNGIEIYEGDILLVVEDGDVENSVKHHVEFNPVCGGYIIDTPNNCYGDMTTLPWAAESCYFEYEVIGNIYENPELLL